MTSSQHPRSEPAAAKRTCQTFWATQPSDDALLGQLLAIGSFLLTSSVGPLDEPDVDEHRPGAHQRDELAAVHPPPPLLDPYEQLEHHGNRGLAPALPLVTPVRSRTISKATRHRVRGTQVLAGRGRKSKKARSTSRSSVT